MDPNLMEAARTGNIEALYSVIQEDPYVLETIEKVPFVDTPLHVAASAGHINFAMEMMNLKPSFGRKLNQHGWSPIHLAVENKKSKLAIRLLETDKDLARVKGKEGMTPLHLVSKTGDLHLLFEILEACPKFFEDVTVNHDTALHLALKNDQIEAFNLLMGWLLRSRHKDSGIWGRKTMNWRDNEDNTLMHIAAKRNQTKELKTLVECYFTTDVKVRNSKGLTVLEIMKQKAENVQEQVSCEIETQDVNQKETETKYKKYLNQLQGWDSILVIYGRFKNNLSVDMLNALLVITALVITATFQSSLSPPGGVFQADGSVPTSKIHVLQFSGNRVPKLLHVKPKSPGIPVMDPAQFTGFWLMNSLTLWLTIGMTIWLLVPRFIILITPLSFLGACYHYSMVILSPSTAWAIINICALLLVGLLPAGIVCLPIFRDVQAVLVDKQKLRKFIIGLSKRDTAGWNCLGKCSKILRNVCGEPKRHFNSCVSNLNAYYPFAPTPRAVSV